MAESQKQSVSRTHHQNHLHPIRLPSPAQQMHPNSGNTGTTRGPSSSSSTSSKGPSSFRFNAVSEERRHLLSRNWRFREWARHGQLNVPVEVPEEEERAANQKQIDEGKSKQAGEGKSKQAGEGKSKQAGEGKSKQTDEGKSKQTDEGKSKQTEPPKESESDEPPGFRWVTIEIV